MNRALLPRNSASFQPGDPFNPYRMFTGLFIPECLARSRSVSAGAKLAWGRLARYAGEDGRCYPTVKVLGAEIGVRERQVQNYLRELERAQLIRRVSRFNERAQASNAYEFLWHEIFSGGVHDHSGEGVHDSSPRGVHDPAPKESQDQESPSEERKRLRLSGRESQKPQFAARETKRACEQHALLKEALADYMHEESDCERVYPADRHVVDVIDAAAGATEAEVISCLRYLYDERGLRPGARNGPRHFSWFPTVVGDYFRQKRQRIEAANPAGNLILEYGGLPEGVFESMTEIIERVSPGSP